MKEWIVTHKIKSLYDNLDFSHFNLPYRLTTVICYFIHTLPFHLDVPKYACRVHYILRQGGLA